MISAKRWPNSPRLTRPHIYFFGGFWRVTAWNHVISTLGIWREANDFAARKNAEPKEKRK